MGKMQIACPYRSISNEYCDEYETIKGKLEILDIIENNSIVIESNQTVEITVELFKGNQEKEIKKIKKWFEKN
ncbi:MAG: hypothetical protein KH328_01480 [Staphylococcus sp.]|nr:hypothetical protein [Staphylococcus sp.]